MTKVWLAWLAALAVALVSIPGEAQPASPEACANAFERGQIERRGGKLLVARRELLMCAQEACPAVVRQQCVILHEEVNRDVPSIMVTAADRAGRDVVDVRLLVDGQPVAQRLDGKAIELDPGEHRVVVEGTGIPRVEQTIVLAARQQARLVRMEIPIGESRAARTDPPNEGPGLVLAGVGFGLCGAALVAGIVTGVIAYSKGAPCRDGEASCDGDYIADHEPLAHVATASFVVAGAGAILGIVGLAMYASPTSVEVALRGSF